MAGFGVDCADLRRNESLTGTGRLYKLNPHTGKWHLELTRTGRWANLAKMRSIDLREPCAAAMFKASFRAVLRYPNGAVAGRVAVESGRLQVVVPLCLILIFGALYMALGNVALPSLSSRRCRLRWPAAFSRSRRAASRSRSRPRSGSSRCPALPCSMALF